MIPSHVDTDRRFLLSGITEEDLDRVARQLVSSLGRTASLGLLGTLGSGKTRLTQAICQAIGVEVEEVTSPTFTLMQSHRGDPAEGESSPEVLHHLDAYRLADTDEFLELGVDELFEQAAAWTVVEWADRVADVMPAATAWVSLEIEADPSRRTITLGSQDASVARRLSELVAELGAVDRESDRG